MQLRPHRLALAVALSFAATPMSAIAQAVSCPQFFPGGQPPVLLNPKLAQRTTMLCNDAYAVLASGVTHGPLWSAERPTAATVSTARNAVRESQFYPDDRLPFADQAQLDDYRRSGFDRGHMTPSGDMPGGQAQQQSFSLANMVPQTPELNRGVWTVIETAVRDLAAAKGELYVVTGPAFQGQQIQSIGPDGVLVPSSTWKAIYSPRDAGTGAYPMHEHRHASVRGDVGRPAIRHRWRGPLPGPSREQAAMALPGPEAGNHSRQRHRYRSRRHGGVLELLLGQ